MAELMIFMLVVLGLSLVGMVLFVVYLGIKLIGLVLRTVFGIVRGVFRGVFRGFDAALFGRRHRPAIVLMRCPRPACGEANPEHAMYCRRCGRAMEWSTGSEHRVPPPIPGVGGVGGVALGSRGRV